ncbi:MAG: flagellar protein FlaG [Marinobacter sp. T13-3]|nr:MAG: flagellar protein FlaG [Marinobacter sp. T13-3]
MNDVNLNSPDLKLVRTNSQAPARANASPQNEGDIASAQKVASGVARDAAQLNRLDPVPEAQKALAQNERVQEGRKLGEAVSQLNDYVQSVSRDLQFEVDNDLGQTIVKVVDQETKEVIRQIPDEVALRLAEKLQQDEPLTLFNIKV